MHVKCRQNCRRILKANGNRLYVPPSSSTYAAGSTGGEASHTLTVNEMPNHVHHASNGEGAHFVTDGTESGYGSARLSQGGRAFVLSALKTAGGGLSHNNMPPYLAVYIWKRTA